MKAKNYLSSPVSGVLSKFIILAISVILLGASSCKSKKKIVDVEEDEIEVVNPDIMKSKIALKNILDDDGTMSIEEMEKVLNDVKKLNLDDEELNGLIAKVEAKIAREKEDLERKKEAAKPENMLRSYFSKIANASSELQADKHIEDALKMFTSDKSTVLIIIAQDAHIKDYDKPTNINKYLNYLKDTKNNSNSVEEIKWDANQKIKTLILKKN
ncbi:MAG: hypothetical protein ABFS35_06220 [Bacteroidota bacterium]